MVIGSKNFDFGSRTYVMGILNITPDSFSDGGQFNTEEEAIRRVRQMIEEGMDLLDIGGESTRPGHEIVSTEEEIRRTIPLIRRIAGEFSIPISIDTSKAEVAKKAIEAGAHMVNDVWGLRRDRKMAGIIQEFNVPCCLMHNREEIMKELTVDEVIRELLESVEIAKKAGIPEENIILDPGIGFKKTLHQNLLIMNHLELFRELGYPVLLGTSRKTMIGLTLDLPVSERLEGTLATSVVGIMKGIDILRVHDVLANKRAAIMTDAIVRKS